MGTIKRGFLNAFRNSIRTISIVFILAVSIIMALVMLMSLKTVQAKIDNVKSSIGNIVTVSPAGVRGFEGGGELLTDQKASDISAIPNVASVTKTLSDRLRKNGSTIPTGGPQSQNNTIANNTTNLDSSISPGSFGNRQRANENGGSTSLGTFSVPIMLTGVSDLSSVTGLSSLGISKFDILSGNKIDSNSSDNLAMIGTALAAKNNLSVGSTFLAYGQTITVTGIFDAGSEFANATIVMPIKTVQNLSGQAGAINTVIVEVNSIDNVSAVQTAIKDKLGSTVDVSSQQDASNQAIAPLQNIKNISFYSLVGALVAGSIIIFLTMVMIVRERRREIGVLKAIGASNFIIATQFTVESLVLTLISSVVGMILGLALSNPILSVLVNNAVSSNQTTAGGGTGRQLLRLGAGFGNSAGNALRNLHTNVGAEIILYGLGAAVLVAILGSAIPAFIISKIRPAEVLRSE